MDIGREVVWVFQAEKEVRLTCITIPQHDEGVLRDRFRGRHAVRSVAVLGGR